MKTTLVLLLALAVTPAHAQERAAKKERLAKAAEVLEQLSDEDYQEVSRASPPFIPRGRYRRASRAAALGTVYETLAAFEYKDALALEASGEVEAALKASVKDAEALAIDPGSLQESGWFTNWVNYEPPRAYRGNAVAAVRGGRSLDTESGRRMAKAKKGLDENSGQLKEPALSPKDKARLHLSNGKLYEQLASALAGLPEADAQTDKAPAELSPKEIYQKAGPSVVLLLCAGKDGAGELGTGSLIDRQGHILTNAHVVIRDSTGRPFETIRVYRKPARITGDAKLDMTDPLEARVVRWDRGLDLALIELKEKPEGLEPLGMGDSDPVEAGDPVVAIGHPEQGGLWTLTQGVVSTVVADLGGVKGKDAFQTDASINRGNSGGPLLSRGGALIGVNTSMARKAADGLTITAVNFSVKSNVARRWLASPGGEPAAPPPPAAEAAPMPRPKAPMEPPVAVAPAPAAPAAAAPKILTPVKPFKAQDVIAQGMAEMEDLEQEMRGEFEKRRGAFEGANP